jgi:N-acetylmuramoyl-L-alanine amidase
MILKEDKPVFYALRFFAVSLFSALFIFFCGFALTKYNGERGQKKDTPVFNQFGKTCFVLDAGHGGEDAGAVAEDGTLEKDLNLEISNLVRALCILNGWDVKMTRTEDTLLYDYYDDLEDYTGKKKVYDLKNRLKIAEEHENALYLGIHMNKFSQSKYSGAQIYYSKNNVGSYSVATNLSKNIKEYLQPRNNRAIKAADSSIYILNNIKNPAILVECGFLSNEDELSLLKAEEYRAKMALVIFSSIYS